MNHATLPTSQCYFLSEPRQPIAAHCFHRVGSWIHYDENSRETLSQRELITKIGTISITFCCVSQFKQAGTLNVVVVANGKTERHTELPPSGFKLDI
jgi:hypothetical protein